MINNTNKKSIKNNDARLTVSALFVIVIGLVTIVQLFNLMIFRHESYKVLAAGAHEVSAQFLPKRGEIFIQSKPDKEYPVAINRDVFLVYADTRDIENDETAENVAEELASFFGYNDEEKFSLYLKLNKRDDPYEPIEQEVEEALVDQIRVKNLAGIGFIQRQERFYPEANLAAQVIGFLGKDEDGNEVGRYGVEGYWDEVLSGSGGFVSGSRSATGRLINLGASLFKPAEDGADILLTIDRTLQFKACEKLREAVEVYAAERASLVIMDPKTGAVLTMCNIPDFDLNTYNQVESIDIYNNNAIFTPYEPGSIFKPIAMSAAINEEVVKPESVFYDTGVKKDVCEQKPIYNADNKKYEDQTMVGILENSINTGMVYVVEQLGKNKFNEYVKKFGFGVKEGIELDSEISGTVDSLSKNKGDKIDCYAANGSFGQGLTVTPLQMATAFSAIVNGGLLMKPYIVDEVRYHDGKVEKTKPQEIRRVISNKASSLMRGMLVSVIDNGQASRAKVPGYYLGGKTGTAQIPGPGGYLEDATNHSFVGFGPSDNPYFVVAIRLEKPANARFSSGTAAPTFASVAEFILQYFEEPPIR